MGPPQPEFLWAVSSGGERYLDTVEVTGSIPVLPTTKLLIFIKGFFVYIHKKSCLQAASYSSLLLHDLIGRLQIDLDLFGEIFGIVQSFSFHVSKNLLMHMDRII